MFFGVIQFIQFQIFETNTDDDLIIYHLIKIQALIIYQLIKKELIAITITYQCCKLLKQNLGNQLFKLFDNKLFLFSE